jgi:hypothetical protein
MAERYKFPIGNTVGVQENLFISNAPRIKLQREKIDRFKELVRNGEIPSEAKRIVIEEYKLNRAPNAGTPKWMTKGRDELISEGFDYKAGPPGPKNVGGKKKAAEKRTGVTYTFDDRLKKAKTKVTKGTGLGKAYELAHTANIFQAKNLGFAYPIDSLAIQPFNINNKVAEVLNDEMKPLYKRQLDLFKKMKKKNTPNLKKQMDAVNLELMELVATGGKQGDVAANILKPIHVNADTLKPRVMDLGFDTSTEIMSSPGATTKATAAGSLDDVMARGNIENTIFNLARKDAAANGPICGLVRSKKANGGTISCVDAVEDAIQNEPEKLVRDASKIDKFKNAASKFLSVAKKGGRFGAFAAIGATAGAVKEFMSDDPTSYLSDENQQKNMLIDMVTEPVMEERDPGITSDAQLPVLGAVTAAGAIPGAAEYYKDRRGIRPNDKFTGPMKQGVGKIRAAASPISGLLGKGLAATGTPLGMLALEPLYIGSQLAAGDSVGEIATNPINYLGAAFASPLTQQATKFASPAVSNIMRLGISPTMLKTVSRRFGLPGLALSAGISGYEMYQNKKAGRGLFDDG